jgi:hypothetical protein
VGNTGGAAARAETAGPKGPNANTPAALTPPSISRRVACSPLPFPVQGSCICGALALVDRHWGTGRRAARNIVVGVRGTEGGAAHDLMHVMLQV